MLGRFLTDISHLVRYIRQGTQAGRSRGPHLADKQAQIANFLQLLYENRKSALVTSSRKEQRSERAEFANAVVRSISELELLLNSHDL